MDKSFVAISHSNLTALAMQRALFLDRDGVINLDKNYVYKISDIEFVSGIFELCQVAKHLGFKIIVVTNQSGIARGYFSEKNFIELMHWMRGVFLANGSDLDAFYFCPFHPDMGIGSYKRESEYRKPNPGMILKARDDFSLNLAESFLVGDRMSDVQAGFLGGVGANFLLTGIYSQTNDHAWFRSIQSLGEVVPFLEGRK